MKKPLLNIFCLAVVILSCTFLSTKTVAQTAGTLTFSVNLTSHSGSYGADHYVAIWIENNSNTFVKTKLKKADSHATGSHNHLPAWKASSALNVVDATTGASLTSYSTPQAITWNATDVNGTVVPDGTYKVRVECTWGSSTSTANTTFTFTKSTTAVHLTPTGDANFTGVTLDWVPVTTNIDNNSLNSAINIFPNPTTGILNIDLSEINNSSTIQIHNLVGKRVYQEKIEKSNGIKTVDLNNFENGVYLVNIQYANETKTYKVVLNR